MRLRAHCFTLFLLAFCVAMPGQAKAWGKFGHLVVCDLAYRKLTDTSRTKLKTLFQSNAGGVMVKGKGKLKDRRYTSFNIGCLEEDELPRKHANDHFINVSRDTKTITGNACPTEKSCTLAGIQRDLNTLKDESAKRGDRVFALMAIGHWIGDIHQPLHTSFADDKGGNGIAVTLDGKCATGSPRPKNLHSIWDNCLLDSGMFQRVRLREDFKKSWSRFTITYRAVDTLLARTSLTEEKTLVGVDPWAWAAESYVITLSPEVLYCIKVGDLCQYSATAAKKPDGKTRNQPINQAYLAAFAPVAEERVKRAGFRLAHLINLALDPGYTVPIQGSMQKP